MEPLINLVKELQNSPIKETIDKRMSEFNSFQTKSSNEIFKELCFCFLTANFQAQKSIYIQQAIGDGFLDWPEEKIVQTLKSFGHRFPNMRTKFILEARPLKDTIKQTLQGFENDKQRREWIVKNVKGIGMKESSHFLRNIGYSDVAIIDFHIIDILADHNQIEKPKNKSLTPKLYIQIESLLEQLAKATNTSLGELDLYLWYKETGSILK